MKNKYKYGNRCSYNIYYHIILFSKYRKPLLGFGQINQDIISISNVCSYIENQ
jgi:REP element-mobilizing transposase RayT